MPRLLFEKTGNAVWISHLDLMRLFQRAFKRAGLSLVHSNGFTSRPQIAIALPLSVGVESRCELLDFELDGPNPPADEIRSRLNRTLIPGVHVAEVIPSGRKIRELALLECRLSMEYDNGIPANAKDAISNLFLRPRLFVEKKGKNGTVEQDILPLIRRLEVTKPAARTLEIRVLLHCQEPALNPAQLPAAIKRYLPEFSPDFVKISRMEIFDIHETIFR